MISPYLSFCEPLPTVASRPAIFHNSIKKTTAESTAAEPKGSEAMSNIASAADGVIERAFDLPFGYCATFIWRGSDNPIEVHWLPDLPHIRKPRLQRKLLTAYETARRGFFEDVAAVVGGKVLILETG